MRNHGTRIIAALVALSLYPGTQAFGAAAPTYQNPLAPTTASGSLISRGPRIAPETTALVESFQPYRTTRCLEPTVTREAGRWDMWCVTAFAPEHPHSGITHFASSDGANWNFNDIVSVDTGFRDIRGPEVAVEGDRWRLYFSADRGEGSQVFVMSSSGRSGPWREPELVSETRGLVSPSITGDWLFAVSNGRDIPRGIHRFPLDASHTSVDGAGTRISDGRYGDVEIVQASGIHWLLATDRSASNDATAASLVVSVSAFDPSQPFRDSSGRSLMSGGGDVFLGSNTSDWAAPANPAIVDDAGGNIWVFYDALNKSSLTRELLLDRVTFPSDVPQVRGGEWTSSIATAGPADAVLPDSFMPPTPASRGAVQFFDTYDVTPVPRGVRANPFLYSVSDGKLRVQFTDADLAYGSSSAMVLGPMSMGGAWTAAVRVAVPRRGRAGLVVYSNDDEYLELTATESRIFWTAESGSSHSVTSAAPVPPPTVEVLEGDPSDRSFIWLRIDRSAVDAAGRANYTAWTSTDGIRWNMSSVRSAALGHTPVVGVSAMGGVYNTEAVFDEFQLHSVG